ncbi:septation protein SepH [Pedococcus soli]
MRNLRLIGVHEDGQQLLLSDSGGEQFSVPLDEPLRAAVRRDRPRLGQLQIEIDGGMRPREVQAMIRAGLSADDVADRSGWTVEKVRRYEGPILAEREYVAGLARAVRLRGRAGAGSTTPTLSARVSARLSGRGVDPAAALWDSARNEAGEWTVLVTFPAGGREREARWHFDVPARTVTAADDEARWLSEEDTGSGASPLPTPHLATPPVRATTVYDVEAEGGVQATPRRAAPQRTEEPLDLMTAMRERASHRGRPRRRKASATQTPGDDAPREDALPLEDLAYDPETMPPPPAARGPHPLDPVEESAGSRDDAVVLEAPDEVVPDPGVEPSLEAEAEVEVEDVATVTDPAVETAAAPEPTPEPTPAPEPAAQPEPAQQVDRLGAVEAGADDRHEDVGPAAEKADQDDAPAAKPRPAKKAGRRSVPSWDDVMFGARTRD